ncbi:hypothetical protein ANCCAN_21863, partial [Ancylostoma caninum]
MELYYIFNVARGHRFHVEVSITLMLLFIFSNE